MIDSLAHGESALRYVTSFEHKYGRQLLNLAFHAALPVVINADLVHLLRINFFLDPPDPLPFTAEADLLLSSLCYDIGDGLYEIAPKVRNILLQMLVKEYSLERIREIATLLWQYNERYAPWGDRPELERAQQLTALNFLDPLKAKQWLEEAEIAVGPAPSVEREWFVAMWKEIEQVPEIFTTTSQFNLLGREVSELKLIPFGEEMHEAEVLEWFVKEGDTVKRDQTVVKVETDLAIIEIPAPLTGRVFEIRVKSGQTAQVGDVLAVFDTFDAHKEESQADTSNEFHFRELLRQFRIRANMTQQALADKIGIHRRTISAWENGNSLPKNRSMVIDLAKALHLNEQDTNRLLNQGFVNESPIDVSKLYTFGELLAEFRIRNAISQEVLGRRLNVNRRTIIAWEQGEHLPKTRERVLELAKALSLGIEDTNKLLQVCLFSPVTAENDPAQLRIVDEAHKQLRGSQLEQLSAALLSAYPSRDMLKQMMRIELNKNLDIITRITHFQGTIDNLIHSAEAEGWIKELVIAAHKFKPDNQRLREFYQKYVLEQVTEEQPPSIIQEGRSSEVQERSHIGNTDATESQPSSNSNDLQQFFLGLGWPGPDENAIINEMLKNPDSPHWRWCQDYVTSLVMKQAVNIPIDLREEITMNAMYRIVRYLPDFKRQSRLTTWIGAIVRSCIVDASREARRASATLIPTPEDAFDDAEDELDNPEYLSPEFVTSLPSETNILIQEELQEIAAAVQEFVALHANQERNSTILRMVLFQDYSVEDTARVLGINAPVVSYVVRSARRFIREKLGRELP